MKVTKAATSVIEAMVIMLIIVTGVVGMYNIYNESLRLSDLTAQRLQAIEVAREGVEAIENIRNTNWILYASDYGNCWNTINYDNRCIGFDVSASIDPTTNPYTDISAGSYILYQHPTQKRWFLESRTSNNSFDQNYRDNFEVFRGNDDGFYTQSGTNNNTVGKTPLAPIFTREIIVSYPTDSNDSVMNITSLVKWDGRGDLVHKIELDISLTNWKNDN